MNYGEGGLSASDVALLTGNGNNGGFGNNGDGWWIILLFLLGFGRNGFGGGYGGGGGIGENYVLATDFATIERKLDGVNSGICDATFALNNTMTNGFAGVQQTLCQGFNGVNTAIYQNGFNTERGLWNVSSQIANCCCDVEKGIMGINYNMSMNTNTLQQTACNNTRDIIENQNANYRALHDEIVANKIEAKNERIAELEAKVNKLQLAASQEAQSNYLVNTLGPKCPVASYIVPNPNCCYDYTVSRNACGCGGY